MKYIIMLALLSAMALSGCYYDKAETLYPEDYPPCDTSAVGYQASVVPLMGLYCNSCHSTARADGGVITDTYPEVIKTVNDGTFMGSMRYHAGFSPMPKNMPPLNKCEIRTLQIWIDNGAQND